MPDVQFEGLTKTHRGPAAGAVVALRGLTLTVAAGECVVLVGPSGAGKTTTLRLLAGLEEPDSGTVRIGGRDLRGVPPSARGVSMVFQDHPLFPHLTVAENVGFGMRLRKVPRPEVERRVAELAEFLGLGGLLGRRPEGLSGGERQRVALGMALARRPEVLLLDEPLAQLDLPQRRVLRAEIRRVQRETRVTTLHVTHDREEALALADRLAVLRDGALQQFGPPAELRSRPANAFVEEFLGGREPASG